MRRQLIPRRRYARTMHTDILIRDVPEDARARLEARARLHGCTVEDYIRDHLIGPARPEDRAAFREEVRAAKAGTAITFSPDEVAAFLEKERP